MSARFKVEFQKHGIKYSPHYLGTIEGAIKKAQSKGFDDSFDSWNNAPYEAFIFERDGESWEQIATVTERGVVDVNHADRTSVKRDQNQILQAKNRITMAEQLQRQLQKIASEKCVSTKN